MKCKTVYGCLTPQLCRKVRECAAGPSERATSEPAGQAKVVAAVATGSLPVSSAEALANKWAKLSAVNDTIASASSSLLNAEYHDGIAEAYRLCAEELRRHAGLPDERQPEENIPGEPQPPKN